MRRKDEPLQAKEGGRRSFESASSKPTSRKPAPQQTVSPKPLTPPRAGATLLELRNALMRAKECRRVLDQLEFSSERWMEIVTEVDPEIRFMVHPQVMDAIVQHLKREGKPMARKALVRELSHVQVATAQRVRQTITLGLRSAKLALFPNKSIGLAEWKEESR